MNEFEVVRIPSLNPKANEVKQVIILRVDLKMGKGKMVAQGSHAAVQSALFAINHNNDWFKRWQRQGTKKVALKVNSEEELLSLYRLAEKSKLPRAIINDAGLTQLEPGTTTAIAIGPAPVDQLSFTSQLKLL